MSGEVGTGKSIAVRLWMCQNDGGSVILNLKKKSYSRIYDCPRLYIILLIIWPIFVLLKTKHLEVVKIDIVDGHGELTNFERS